MRWLFFYVLLTPISYLLTAKAAAAKKEEAAKAAAAKKEEAAKAAAAKKEEGEHTYCLK